MKNHLILSITILLIIQNYALKNSDSTEEECQNNSDCTSLINSFYICDLDSNTCYHKPLMRNFDFKIAMGILINFLVNIISNSIGVSGSGVVYAVLIFLFNFTAKDAIPIYKVCNIMGVIVNFYFIFTKRRKDNPNKLYISWSFCAFCIPLLLSGSMIGVLINAALPGFYLLIFIFLTLIVISIKTYQKVKLAIKKEKVRQDIINKNLDKIKEESNLKIEHLKDTKSEALLHRQEQHLDEGILEEQVSQRLFELEGEKSVMLKVNDKEGTKKDMFSQFKRDPLYKILLTEYKAIGIILISLFLLIIGNLSKGSPINEPIFDLDQCSFLSFVFFFGCCLLSGLISLCVVKDLEGVNNHQIVQFGIGSFLSGIVAAMGISGSVFFSSVLLILNLESMILTTLSAVSLFSASGAAVIQFQINGALDFRNSMVIGVTSLAGSMIGNLMIQKVFKNSSRKDYIVSIILFWIVIFTMLVLPVIAIYDIQTNKEAFNFGSVC